MTENTKKTAARSSTGSRQWQRAGWSRGPAGQRFSSCFKQTEGFSSGLFGMQVPPVHPAVCAAGRWVRSRSWGGWKPASAFCSGYLHAGQCAWRLVLAPGGWWEHARGPGVTRLTFVAQDAGRGSLLSVQVSQAALAAPEARSQERSELGSWLSTTFLSFFSPLVGLSHSCVCLTFPQLLLEAACCLLLVSNNSCSPVGWRLLFRTQAHPFLYLDGFTVICSQFGCTLRRC